MAKETDIRVKDVSLYFLPVKMRVPFKFGIGTYTSVTVGRACVRVENARGDVADGWGETPLSVGWAWPSDYSYDAREKAFVDFCVRLAGAWKEFDTTGHPMEIGHEFNENRLDSLLEEFNAGREGEEAMPHLAALISCSLFDLALHDAYGNLHGMPTYATYNARYMNRDLAAFLTPADDADVSFEGKYPEDFFVLPRPDNLLAWHLVGGKDPVERSALTGDEPDDGYPVLLQDWIDRDGLECLKVKLRGNDSGWDYDRLVRVGDIAVERRINWLSADFNCTVRDPAYVNDILDRLMIRHPRMYGKILYVEQPFPYDMERYRIDAHSVSARKPLFMDESCHDWRFVRLGRSLGWTGVALKTCKTQTGALLSLCWAKAHGMTLMVQDLTNPMLAQIPHLLLAAHAGTIMGVETNAMQFYPRASVAEAVVHPGLYERAGGHVDLTSIEGSGFGYRVDEIDRELPDPAVSFS